MDKDFSIKTEEAKIERKASVVEFANKYGNGITGLSETQKNNRIEKLLGPEESNKIKGLGKDKDKGVELFKNASSISKPRNIDGEIIDPLPNDIKNNLKDFPDDPFEVSDKNSNKLLNINIKDNGGIEIEGISINGKENDVKERTTWGVSSVSDKDLARLELRQFKQGILKEVSDRTMAIHEANGDLDAMLEDPNIDTNEDKPTQY